MTDATDTPRTPMEGHDACDACSSSPARAWALLCNSCMDRLRSEVESTRCSPMVGERESLKELIADFRLSNWTDHEGNGLPLVDRITSGGTIKAGMEQIDLLADEITVFSIERAALAASPAKPPYANSTGYALAMRVMQSDLYPTLDGLERAECDEFIRRGQSGSAAPAPLPPGFKLLKDSTHDERSWPEDAGDENGNYTCGCHYCGREFIGYKRRVTCRVCAHDGNALPPSGGVQPSGGDTAQEAVDQPWAYWHPKDGFCNEENSSAFAWCKANNAWPKDKGTVLLYTRPMSDKGGA